MMNTKTSKQHLQCLLALLVLFVVVILPVTHITSADSSSYHEVTEDLIEQRKKLGWVHDPDVLDDLSNRELLDDDNLLGIPLTIAEKEDLDVRIEMQEHYVHELRKEIESILDKNEFAGLYIDQRAGGIVKVGLTDELNNKEEYVLTIKDYFKFDERIDFFEAEYSESELNNTHGKIAEKISTLKEEGITISGISTDIINNQVEVGVAKLDSETKKYLAKRFKDYRGQIIFKEKPMDIDNSRFTWHGHMEAGLAINRQGGSGPGGGNGNCTSNIGARDSNTGEYFVITAAHCSYLGNNYTQGGVNIGTVARTLSTHFADALAIRLSQPSWATSYVYTSEPSERQFTNSQTYIEDNVGDFVVMSGRTSGVQYGNITSINHTSPRSWGTLYLQRKADYESAGGDSGAPVYTGNTIKGISSGISDGEAVFSHIGYALEDLNLVPLWQ